MDTRERERTRGGRHGAPGLGLAVLATVGLADFTLISLRQLGVIRHLPEIPVRSFDSDHVNTSAQAYTLGIPDGPMGAGLYVAILGLLGGRGSRRPIFDVLLGAAALAGVGGAAKHLGDMIRVEKKGCTYCLVGAGINFAIAALAMPRLIRAVGGLARRGR